MERSRLSLGDINPNCLLETWVFHIGDCWGICSLCVVAILGPWQPLTPRFGLLEAKHLKYVVNPLLTTSVCASDCRCH